MKKLLTILGSLTIAVGASASVVACGKQKDEDNDTGSVFIDNKGNLKIDSEALLRWYLEHNGVGIGNKQLKEFFQLFAVGIMKEAQKENSLFNDITPSTDEHKYAIENFKEILKEKWGTENTKDTSTVQGAAKAAWDKKVDDIKREVGEKKWEKTLVNRLAKDFPYVKKEFESLKKAFINNEILTNKDGGALAVLTKTLTTDYSQKFLSVASNKETLTSEFFNNWKGTNVSVLASEIYSYVSNDQNKTQAKYLNLVNLINATGGSNEKIATKLDTEISEWKLSSINWLDVDSQITEPLIDDLMHRLNEKYDAEKASGTVTVGSENFKGSHAVWKKWYFVDKNGNNLNNQQHTFFNLVDQFPNPNFINSSLDKERVFGWLTNSQKFVVDQYFKYQKPVSISEVVFKKASDGKLEQNINGQNFISPTTIDSQTTWTQFYGLYDFLRNYVVEQDGWSKGITQQIQGTSQYNFDTIFGNSIKDNVGKIRLNGIKGNNAYYWDTNFYETKNDEKLLTLSDTGHSNILKYSVYDFLQSTPTNLYTLNTDTKDPNFPTNPTVQDITNNLMQKWGYTNSTVASNIAYSIVNAPNNSTGDHDANQKTILNGLYATLNLIEQLNRKLPENLDPNKPEDEYSTSDQQANNKVYQVLNAKQGIIAFIDEKDGLHITKINGYDILKEDLIGEQKSNFYKKNENNYINENNAYARLNEYGKTDASGNYRYIYQDYNGNIGTTNGETDEFTEKLVSRSELNKVANYGVAYDDLNKSITNAYERFLINNSILSGGQANEKNPAFYKFNLLKDALDSVKNNAENDDKLSTNNSWLWDYIKNLLELNTDKDLLGKFMKFDSNDDLSQELEEWYLKQLSLNTGHTIKAGWTEFKNGWNSWNQAIDKTKKGSENENKDLPLMKLAYGLFTNGKQDNTHLNNIRNTKKFDPFKITLKSLSDSDLANKILNYSFEITIGDYRNFNINQTKKGGRE